jgi:hypothetical protein
VGPLPQGSCWGSPSPGEARVEVRGSCTMRQLPSGRGLSLSPHTKECEWVVKARKPITLSRLRGRDCELANWGGGACAGLPGRDDLRVVREYFLGSATGQVWLRQGVVETAVNTEVVPPIGIKNRPSPARNLFRRPLRGCACGPPTSSLHTSQARCSRSLTSPRKRGAELTLPHFKHSLPTKQIPSGRGF